MMTNFRHANYLKSYGLDYLNDFDAMTLNGEPIFEG